MAEQFTDDPNLSKEDSDWLVQAVGVALKQSAVANDNGARAVRNEHVSASLQQFVVTYRAPCLTVTGSGSSQVDCGRRGQVCQRWWSTQEDCTRGKHSGE